MKKLIVCHATGETVLHKAARLGYEVINWSLVYTGDEVDCRWYSRLCCRYGQLCRGFGDSRQQLVAVDIVANSVDFVVITVDSVADIDDFVVRM